jgi:DNA-binding NarL/FixJ family response regulator
MFEPATQALPPRLTRASRGQVGLLADGDVAVADALERIGAILAHEGFITISLESGEVIAPGELTAIVLWLARGSVSITSAIEPLAARFAHTPLVLVCASIERRGLRAALAAGAAGVVSGEELEHGLGACVAAVGAGQVCVPRQHWRDIEPPVLSVRERQVLALVAMGYMNRQIADRLFLAESTVKSHLSSAFSKLGVHSRSEAAELILSRERGLDIGLIEPIEELPASLPTVAR